MMKDELTFIIKTCDRYKCLKSLLSSIKKYYKNVKIIIVDDSEYPYKDKIIKKFPDLDIDYNLLPVDSGVCYGRNYALKKVKTKYFCLLDDDFIFDKTSNLEAGLEMIKEKDVDILGGYIKTYCNRNKWYKYPLYYIEKIVNYYIPQNYTGTIKIKNDELIIDYKQTVFKKFYKTDIVLNYFIAKTKVIQKKNLWDEEIKIGEHSAFFYKAKLNKLKVVSTNTFCIRHCPIQTKEYQKKRYRNSEFFKLFLKKYNIRKIECHYEDARKNFTMYNE